MDFDRDLYALAWTAFRANYAGFAAAGLLLAFLEPAFLLVGMESGAAVGNAVVSAMINLVAQWTLLNGGRPFDGAAINRLGRWVWVRFIWWSILLTLPGMVAFLVMLSGWHGRMFGLLLAGLVFIAVYAVTLAIWGTILPEIAAKGRGSLKEAGRRGGRTFFATLGDLIVGPGVFTVALMIVLVVVWAIGVPVTPLYPGGGVSWMGTFLNIAVMLVGIYGNALFAAVLCRAYRHGSGQFGSDDG